MLQQSAREIGRAEEPVRDRLRQIEIALHHQRRVVVRDVMPAD
jgi:hypothetical protein